MVDGTKADALHADAAVLEEVELEVLRVAGGRDALASNLARLFRQAIDEVIDTPRTRRRLIEELEKTEKTYLGTKIEILFRNLLQLVKGCRLDLRVGDREVDVKFTIGTNWTIPPEAIGEVCLLLSCSETSGSFSAGLLVARVETLNKGRNRDGKGTISKDGRNRIRWIFQDAAYPRNFWMSVSPEDARYIMDMSVSGTERIRRLFLTLAGRRIPRHIVEAVAQQKDYMKRLRRNGGARDAFERDGYLLLSGLYDREEIRGRGLEECSRDQFICVKI